MVNRKYEAVGLYLKQYQLVKFQEMCLNVYWLVHFVICKSLNHTKYR